MWMRDAHEKLDAGNFCLFLIISWALWYYRNLLLMENESSKPHQILDFAMAYLQTYNEVSVVPHHRHPTPHPTSWLSPARGIIKINYDGATFDPTHETGISVVARDNSGNCVAWVSQRLARPASAFIVEALAAREAISLALRHYFGRRLHYTFTCPAFERRR
ncbi:hypothetical protein Salat_1857900 [Sesamum alatum]|uniref:RNase H type-1 domain-containing protein n=1 Tax=Sesamum alatum TaxID=300844 RepID=A0AAE1Y318_9LAMI|nr:hypothetical protein Salat_1857900 [Sesamum alatum]